MSNPTARSTAPIFAGRLALQQRVLPTYRLPFLLALADACQGGLAVFAGQPTRGEMITGIDPGQASGFPASLSIHFTTNRQVSNPSSPVYLCWQSELLGWLERQQPQALIVEANPRLRATPAAIRWMHARGLPVLGWGLGAPPQKGRFASWRRRGWPRFLSAFDALVAYSPRGAEQYRQLGFPADRIFVAPNAVVPRPNPHHSSPVALADPQSEAGEGWDLGSTSPTLLFVGRLQPRKRIDLLLKAAAALQPELDPLQKRSLQKRPRLVIVGDGPILPELKALAQQIYPSAEFPGERTGADLEPYFAQADLFVLPGTGGLAVQQAMAHRLPVIAAEGDGTLDALIRPENGWRIPPGSLPALVSTLQTALSDLPRLRRMGVESYRIVAEEVNLETMVGAFLKTLALLTNHDH